MNHGNSGTPFRYTASGTLGSVNSPSGNILGVLTAASAAGTLTIVEGGVTKVNALPLTAGQFVPIPYAYASPLTLTLGGTADFTLFVLN